MRPVGDDPVDAWRALFLRVGYLGLARLFEDALDARAGPHALTPAERQRREMCRREFGLYSPSEQTQVAFLLSRRPCVNGCPRPSDSQTGECHACDSRRWRARRASHPTARPGSSIAVMQAPAERVELIATVHAPVSAGLLARLAQVIAEEVPGARVEAVDGETDLVFVVPAPSAAVRLLEQPENRSPANGSYEAVVDLRGAQVTPTEHHDPDPVTSPAENSRPAIGAAAVGTADAPVIIDPAAGDAETRALRLKLYLEGLDGIGSVPDDVEKAKDGHRRGVNWQDSQKAWHCPWCPRTFGMALHAGRHRPACPYRPGEPLDRKALDAARGALAGVASTP